MPLETLTAIMWLVDGDNSVQDSFQLRVDKISHSLGRQPVVFSIPGMQDPPESGNPKIYALDFGQIVENILLSGVLPDNDPLGTGSTLEPRYPNHAELANIARTWWRYSFETSDFDITNGNILRLQEGPGHGAKNYRVIIQNLQCERVGGDSKWNFKLTLAVVDFPDRVL